MGTVSDEVYEGLRCAVCEERFKPGDAQRFLPGTGERIHTANCEDRTNKVAP